MSGWDIKNFNQVLPEMPSLNRSWAIGDGLTRLYHGLSRVLKRHGHTAHVGVELGITACSGKEVNKSRNARASMAASAVASGYHVLERQPSMGPGSRFWPNNVKRAYFEPTHSRFQRRDCGGLA